MMMTVMTDDDDDDVDDDNDSDDYGNDDVPLVITRWAMPGMPPSLISPSILQSQIYCCSQEIYNTHTLSIVLHPDVSFLTKMLHLRGAIYQCTK